MNNYEHKSGVTASVGANMYGHATGEGPAFGYWEAVVEFKWDDKRVITVPWGDDNAHFDKPEDATDYCRDLLEKLGFVLTQGAASRTPAATE